MKTRIELWQKYRDDIYHNNNAFDNIERTDQQLASLAKKLKQTNLDKNIKPENKIIQIRALNQPFQNSKVYNLNNLIALRQKINKKILSEANLALIDDLDFSSHQLDNLIEIIKKQKMHQKKHISLASEAEQIQLNKVQKIKLQMNSKTKNKINIAIDGPSGSGKSTIAKLLAQKYQLNYINTGLVYRAMALHATNNKAQFTKPKSILRTLKDFEIKLLPDEVVYLNGKDVTNFLKTDDISQKASIVGAIEKVRIKAVAIQKKYAANPGVIMDGRDTTFKIMPQADLKIFLETSPEIRAKRRLLQNQEFGYESNYETILKEIQERDWRDRNREIDPLHVTKDAILIDASHLSIEEVIAKIALLIEQKLKK